MNRRTFLRTAFYSTTVGVPLAGACYGFAESGHLRVDRLTVSVPRLPFAFRE